MSDSNLTRPGTIAAISIGVIASGVLAYAAYFDHRRRTDPDFRRKLKRDSKKTQRMAKEAEEASEKEQKEAVLAALQRAKDEGVPANTDEWEQFFMTEVARGEQMCQDGSDPVDAASCFYRALKVYPQPRELINIYDKTVPKPVLDILAMMIAYDPSISTKAGSSASSDDGMPIEPVE
ncbi:protein import receptor MAS20 [Pseudovirgaria hyperparasitica]|uniref:Mitochondrial import receptor subunit TOM20 n=1 Tax=Pseudovirgaria hyperparasitica TaxID=470096 RepID=A0A6A6VWH5_9PEZI|nr:protein import receptor MAS20 [Pseudovirgaria hyperparasitica]KAF2754603.1 protein import receptor MAS20 [Pseudovirgaria hyperparasitica]